MSRWIKNILAFVILVFLFWYLYKHWDKVRILLEFKISHLLFLYAIGGLAALNNSRINQVLLAGLDTRVSLGRMFLLQNATRLLNLLPMKFGTVFRGNYLKRHYHLAYSHYAVFFLYYTLLMVSVAGAAGLVGLALGYGFSGADNKILAGIFLTVTVTCVLFLFVPLPVISRLGRLGKIINNFVEGRTAVVTNKNIFIVCVAHLVINILLSAVRIGIIYHNLNKSLSPAGCVVLGTVGFVAIVVSITPGALGIRELVLASSAAVIGIPFEIGVMAAVFDRAIMLSWTFVVGGICTFVLWHKSPVDFSREPDT